MGRDSRPRERLGAFRHKQTRVFGRMSEKFDPILRWLVGNDAKERIIVTGNGLECRAGLGNLGVQPISFHVASDLFFCGVGGLQAHALNPAPTALFELVDR
ncbi:MAG: hypothetical protein EOQ83_29695 [Mesorhizobium sp.]|nr:MAG: hypothetical protein EOQ83_29695 [Mesorhizobium sp.]